MSEYRPPRDPVAIARVFGRRLLHAVKSPRWWWQSVLLVGFWVLVGWPVYRTNVAQGVAHTALALILLGGRAWRHSSPRGMQKVEHDYLARKIRLYGLLKRLQFRPPQTGSERAQFQVEALQLIASYVRGHRADTQGTVIFVNLLVEDGDEMVVVARDLDHRKPGARYPKERMVAWEAMRTGEARVAGNIDPTGDDDEPKKYKSIMALPVHGEDRVLGVVSVDSVLPHHFDAECEVLSRYLAPYVCLLAWTLVQNRSSFDSRLEGEQQAGAAS